MLTRVLHLDTLEPNASLSTLYIGPNLHRASRVIVGGKTKCLYNVDLEASSSSKWAVVSAVAIDDPIVAVKRGKVMAVGHASGEVTLFDPQLRTARPIGKWKPHAASVVDLDMSRGDLLASCGLLQHPDGKVGSDPFLKVFDIRNLRQCASISVSTKSLRLGVKFVRFLPHTWSTAIIGTGGGSFRLQDLAQGIDGLPIQQFEVRIEPPPPLPCTLRFTTFSPVCCVPQTTMPGSAPVPIIKTAMSPRGDRIAVFDASGMVHFYGDPNSPVPMLNAGLLPVKYSHGQVLPRSIPGVKSAFGNEVDGRTDMDLYTSQDLKNRLVAMSNPGRAAGAGAGGVAFGDDQVVGAINPSDVDAPGIAGCFAAFHDPVTMEADGSSSFAGSRMPSYLDDSPLLERWDRDISSHILRAANKQNPQLMAVKNPVGPLGSCNVPLLPFRFSFLAMPPCFVDSFLASF